MNYKIKPLLRKVLYFFARLCYNKIVLLPDVRTFEEGFYARQNSLRFEALPAGL